VTISELSLVLANLQNNISGVFVEAVVPYFTKSQFVIILSEALPG
jgi:hypothetical protein